MYGLDSQSVVRLWKFRTFSILSLIDGVFVLESFFYFNFQFFFFIKLLLLMIFFIIRLWRREKGCSEVAERVTGSWKGHKPGLELGSPEVLLHHMSEYCLRLWLWQYNMFCFYNRSSYFILLCNIWMFVWKLFSNNQSQF